MVINYLLDHYQTCTRSLNEKLPIVENSRRYTVDDKCSLSVRVPKQCVSERCPSRQRPHRSNRMWKNRHRQEKVIDRLRTEFLTSEPQVSRNFVKEETLAAPTRQAACHTQRCEDVPVGDLVENCKYYHI